MSAASVPNTFSAGASIIASQHNGNFASLISTINGNLDDTNFGTMTGVITWSISSNVKALSISSSSTDIAVDMSLTGVLASNKAGLKLFSSAAQTTGDALVYLGQTHASSTIPAIRYDDDNGAAFVVDSDGALKNAGAYTPGWMSNVGIVVGATADDIKIQGAAGALSTANPQYVTVPDEDTIGQLKVLRGEADVTIATDGAHWGLDTNGDQTDLFLFVYAINDNATLKYGVSPDPSLTSISDSNSDATAANVTAATDMLVNSTLGSGTWPCERLGWVRANFTDSSDTWAIQSDLEDIRVGKHIPKLYSRYDSNTGQTINNTTVTVVNFEDVDSDSGHGAVTVGAAWKYVAKMAGRYSVNAALLFQDNGNWTAGESVSLYVYKNGANYARIFFHEVEATGTFFKSAQGSDIIDLNAGDYIDIRVNQSSGAANALTATPADVYVSIARN